jgi:hypothetical protein
LCLYGALLQGTEGAHSLLSAAYLLFAKGLKTFGGYGVLVLIENDSRLLLLVEAIG